ncbi:beta-glucosidase [Niabella ginsenosidivorans]|uniref:Beta-glucosidase n=1 Tax=Niabella ginsenosidivorans TaxID=1176587 RepID=A0A1A9I8L3_9BACT|nr:glucoamylase family protein [Niabella ginsenosidivorans]ANH83409.1 beta-glucosidase [Niabella ginsenosidivorans]
MRGAGKEKAGRLSDAALLELVQRQTFAYFWDFAHPECGMPKERNHEHYTNVITTGGTGFGVMAIIVAVERGWITRGQAIKRLLKILTFLKTAEKHHGAFSHWLDGNTGRTIPFGKKDNGADLVETAFLFQGLLTVRQYFKRETPGEQKIRTMITTLWENVEWSWFTREREVLYWHWSPDHKWAMNLKIEGYNEALITYILAAAAPRYSIHKNVYEKGWTRNGALKNGKRFYNTLLPLGPDFGGPLFFAQYSFVGLNPNGLKDRFADYGKQNRAQTKINYRYCVANPLKFKNYGKRSWGLSACDYKRRYREHSPTKDNGTICCSAAISSIPYLPKESMAALRYFYEVLGDKIFGKYGFTESFNETRNWYAASYLAINQGPVILMIENYRTGLLWKLFMQDKDVQKGLQKLGFAVSKKSTTKRAQQ